MKDTKLRKLLGVIDNYGYNNYPYVRADSGVHNATSPDEYTSDAIWKINSVLWDEIRRMQDRMDKLAEATGFEWKHESIQSGWVKKKQ